MTFFERYFELLDGPEPHSSLDLVAEGVEFTIQWADGDDARSSWRPPTNCRLARSLPSAHWIANSTSSATNSREECGSGPSRAAK